MKVTMFCQTTIDGKLSLGRGISSKEILSLLDEEDKRYIHSFRGKVDGIMVGKSTLQIDNPYLTNRYEKDNNPVRIIPTNSLEISSNYNVFSDTAKTIFVTPNKNKKRKLNQKIGSCEIFYCGNEEIDFNELFYKLESDYGVGSIMLEGGGELNWSLLDAGLVNEVILMQLPILVGGRDNVTLVDGVGYRELTLAKRCTLKKHEQHKNYLLLKYLVNN